jgi:hypothetical protein
MADDFLRQLLAQLVERESTMLHCVNIRELYLVFLMGPDCRRGHRPTGPERQ